MNRKPVPPKPKGPPCAEPDCVEFDPVYIWVEPGLPQKLLVLTAIPAFVIEDLSLLASAKLGISQIPVFFISMPVFLFAWFYFLGWLIDRRRYKRILKSAPAS